MLLSMRARLLSMRATLTMAGQLVVISGWTQVGHSDPGLSLAYGPRRSGMPGFVLRVWLIMAHRLQTRASTVLPCRPPTDQSKHSG
jgi:hypothetical protein